MAALFVFSLITLISGSCEDDWRAGSLAVSQTSAVVKESFQKQGPQKKEYSVLGLTKKEFGDWLSEPNTIEFERRLFRVLSRLRRANLERWVGMTKSAKTEPNAANDRLRFSLKGELVQVRRIQNSSIRPIDGLDESCYEIRLKVVDPHQIEGRVSARFAIVWMSELPLFLNRLVGEESQVDFGVDGDSDLKANQQKVSEPILVETEGLFIGRSNLEEGLSGFSTLALDGQSSVFVGKQLKWKPTNFSLVKQVLRQWRENADSQKTNSDSLLANENYAASGLVHLGQNGVDVSVFFEKVSHSLQMSAFEGEAFHQMLAVLDPKDGVFGKAKGQDLRISGVPKEWATPVPLSIVQAIEDSQVLRPQWVKVSGNVVQVVRVRLQPDDLGWQQGLKEYYLVHLRVPIDKKLNIRFKNQSKRSYDHSFPVTVAVKRLPEGLKVGDNRRIFVEAVGHFFRLWRYQSAASIDNETIQLTPLLVGGRFEESSRPTEAASSNPLASFLLLPVGVTVVGLFLAGFYAHSKRRSTRLKYRNSKS